MAGESNPQFVKNVQELLKIGDTVAAVSLFKDDKNSYEIKNNSWDLIPVITESLTTTLKANNLKVFECCEVLLNTVAEKSNPEEALLQFIEEVEECIDDAKFVVLLEPMRKIIQRIPKKRVNSIAWCLNAIQTYLSKSEIPETESLIGKGKLLIDTNDEVQRILYLYDEILIFYANCMDKMIRGDQETSECTPVVHKFLIQLLGPPLAYLDMEIFDDIKSKGRSLAEQIVNRIFTISRDPTSLLRFRSLAENNDIVKPSTVTVAIFFYLVYAEGICVNRAPNVYSSLYLFQNSLHLVTVLLDFKHQVVVEKGLRLASNLMNHVKMVKLPASLLDSEDHSDFCQSLARVIIFNQAERVRKFALDVYKTYLRVFEVRGFYLLVSNLISVLNHSGLIGLTITQYKDMLVNEISSNEDNIQVYFKGEKLLALLRKFCYLHNKEESDLIELSDQIMATLNLLRYLALRDKKNVTQIWDHFQFLEEIYFEPLRKGLELSRAHYELKIKELQEETASGDTKLGGAKLSVIVAGQNLTEMPKQEKLSVLHSSLTAFDIMNSLLSRLLECIEMNK